MERWPAACLVTALVTGLSPDPARGPVRELTAQEAVVIDEWDVPWEGSRPRDPYVAPDGRVWFVGQTADYVARLDPAARDPHTLVFDSRGTIWFSLQQANMIGRFDPVSGAVDLVPVPTPNSRPYGIVVDAEDRPYGMVVDEADMIWLVETGLQPNRFVGFDTRAEELVSVTDIPSGAGSVRHMYYDPERREVWFGTDANTVGRARLP